MLNFCADPYSMLITVWEMDLRMKNMNVVTDRADKTFKQL